VVAELFEGLGAHERAIDLWRDLAQRLSGRTGSALQRARVQTALGDSLHHANDFAGAISAYRAALTPLETANDVDAAPARAHVQCKLGWEHYIVGDAETGKRLIEAATATDVWQRGDAKMRGDVLRAMAWSAGSAGRLAEAEAALRAAVDADAIGRDAADMVAITRRVDLARLISSLGRHAEAEPLFRGALAPFEAAGETDHPMARHITFHFCRLLAAAGRPAEGMALMRRVLQELERQPQPLSPMERELLQIPQAELSLADGRVEDAGALYDAGADAACAIEEPFMASLAWATKAQVFADLGRFGPAMRCIERALELRTKQFGPAHGMVLGTRVAVALVRVAGGEAGAALERVTEVLSAMPARAAAERYGSRRDQAECARALCLLELQRPSEALAIVLEHLPRFAALPAADRAPLTEITLRFVAARCGVLAFERLDDVWPHLRALDELARPLHPHHPQRALVHAAWAQALALDGKPDDAQTHLQQADRVLAAQPSLGPQFRRNVERVRQAMTART
jgi:tetratricopeptide (TPR) repeat protein